MSSPMIARMFGGRCCCAAAGMLGTIKVASNVNTPSQLILISILPRIVWLLCLLPSPGRAESCCSDTHGQVAPSRCLVAIDPRCSVTKLKAHGRLIANRLFYVAIRQDIYGMHEK